MPPWPVYPDTPELIVAAPGPVSAQHRTWHRDRNKTGLAGFELPALLAPFFFEPKRFLTFSLLHLARMMAKRSYNISPGKSQRRYQNTREGTIQETDLITVAQERTICYHSAHEPA